MASLNRVLLIGNLTRDPEVRYTPSGTAVGDLRMATNRKYKTASGEMRDETCFVSVVVWGRQAENCGQFLRKGSSVFVEGRLQYREWEKEGKKFNRLEVVAGTVQFLGPARKGEPRAAAGAEAPKEEAAMAEPPKAEGSPVEEVAPPEGSGGGDEDNLPF